MDRIDLNINTVINYCSIFLYFLVFKFCSFTKNSDLHESLVPLKIHKTGHLSVFEVFITSTRTRRKTYIPLFSDEIIDGEKERAFEGEGRVECLVEKALIYYPVLIKPSDL